jgi:hypothetical protein
MKYFHIQKKYPPVLPHATSPPAQWIAACHRRMRLRGMKKIELRYRYFKFGAKSGISPLSIAGFHSLNLRDRQISTQ